MNTVSDSSDSNVKNIQFYLTASYPCSYLDHKDARSQVASPSYAVDSRVYSQLIRMGFRRSGLFTYRPCCDNCEACIPIRVLVDQFVPTRSQKRTALKHRDLAIKLIRPSFKQEHYALFMRYQAQRHPDGGMNQDSTEQYSQFLLRSQVDSYLVEFSDPKTQQIKAVMLIDETDDGISAVYTFYEPENQSSYGTFAILWAIEFTKKHQLPYLYLGYWIADSKKMNYKKSFFPSEVYRHDQWRSYTNINICNAHPTADSTL